MVQIRDSLPLLDGIFEIDSASMAAGFALSKFHPDFQKQLATSKLHSVYDKSDTGNMLDNLDMEAWFTNIATRINEENIPLLKKACAVVKDRTDTTPTDRSNAYATGIGMADILSYLFADEHALVAAMLYRLARQELIDGTEIKTLFGEDVATLVVDSLALGRLSEYIEEGKNLEAYFEGNNKENLSNIYSILIDTTDDVRAVLIKLAERTFAMRELSFSSQERKIRVAKEVMIIYAPLAHRLGIAQLKWEMEDLAFSYLFPEEYKRIAGLLAQKRSERETYIKAVQSELEEALTRANISFEVSGRVKHIYSIWRKMKKKNLSFHQLYDIRALRVLVPNNGDCYYALGLVHSLWRHIPEQFDDYITNPKPNGYKSLHTAVIAHNCTLEVQIRTFDMHFEAELGMCSHVNYKEGGKNKKNDALTQKISNLRTLLSGDKADKDEQEDLVFDGDKKIYLFSPSGDIMELPKGATVLDFAYHVHTEIGNRAQGARVNGQYVPLTHQPKTGEQVEIITKASREPNRDWLISSLGYITTNRARTKLRQWFNKQDRDKNIETGRLMLAKEFERLSLPDVQENMALILDKFGMGADDLYLSLVVGEIGINQITNMVQDKLNSQLPDTKEIILKTPHRSNKLKIELDGLDNVQIHLAKCCNPVHGESIAGYITIANGVSIHNAACSEYHRLITSDPKRAIRANWQADFGRYQPVSIMIEAYDRRGLLRDLTGIIDKEKVNIHRAEMLSTDDNVAHMKFAVEVANLAHLSRLLAKIEQQPSIIHARRAS